VSIRAIAREINVDESTVTKCKFETTGEKPRHRKKEPSKGDRCRWRSNKILITTASLFCLIFIAELFLQ
jgi:transposase